MRERTPRRPQPPARSPTPRPAARLPVALPKALPAGAGPAWPRQAAQATGAATSSVRHFSRSDRVRRVCRPWTFHVCCRVRGLGDDAFRQTNLVPAKPLVKREGGRSLSRGQDSVRRPVTPFLLFKPFSNTFIFKSAFTADRQGAEPAQRADVPASEAPGARREGSGGPEWGLPFAAVRVWTPQPAMFFCHCR